MNILVVGPHPDDQELGMGGAIALLASQGHAVTLLDVTDGEPTPFGAPEVRQREAAAAARMLSAPGNPVARMMLGGAWGAGLPNRRVEHSLEARHRIAGVIRATQADVLFAPFAPDAHPDHRAVTRLVEDARFDAKLTAQPMPGDQGRAPRYPRWLFHYYATHLRLVPAPSFLLDVSAARPQKRQSILAYHSQFVANPANRHVPDWIDAAGVYFGSRIGAAFAEPFFTHEPLGLRALNDLV